MSKKAKKRLNRFLRLSGRTLANANNARQLVHSKRFAREMAAGGEAQIAAAIERERAAEAERSADLARLMGVWG